MLLYFDQGDAVPVILPDRSGEGRYFVPWAALGIPEPKSDRMASGARQIVLRQLSWGGMSVGDG